MDFHALSRRDLQALSKRNGVKANQTNAAMADALAALPKVDGIEEYVQQPVAEPASTAKPAVQAVAEEEAEEEKKAAAEEEERVALTPDEVIVLDDSEEEKDEEKAPALDVGRRCATRRAPVEPVTAPAARKRAAARKTEKGDAAAEAVPARATRGRSQRTVAEEEAPKARRATRRAVARNTSTEQEEQEKGTQADVSNVEAAAPAPTPSEEGDDGAEDMETVTDAQNEEQFAAAEAQKEDTAAEAVPARTTRGRSQRTVVSAAEDEVPKARRTSRRAAARKTSTEQEEEEEGTKGGVSEVEAAVPAPASSDEGDDGAAKMEAAMDAQNEDQFAASKAEKGDASAEAMPARATRAGRRRTVVSFAEDATPKTRRTSRRANGDVSAMEIAAPAPVASDERGDGAMEVAVDAHNEEQNEPVEEPVRAEPEIAVPARTTRTRSKRTVSFADEEAPMSRRTSRRALAKKTSTEQEEEENVTQGDVSDRAAVSAPASSDEGGGGAEEIEATIDAHKEEQFAVVEAVSARATRARRQRTVVSVAVEEAPKARRTSKRTATMQEEKVQGQQQQDIASDVEAVVPAPVSSDEGGDGVEETEADMEPQNKEQNELVEEQSEEDEGVVADRTPLLKEEEPVAEDCAVDSSVEEQTSTVSSEEIQHSIEDKEMVPAEEDDFTSDASEENEDAEEEPAVAEHVDSSVQEHLVDVQQCEATEEILLVSEDAEMLSVNEVRQTVTSGEATVEADFTSDADHAGEENEDCTAEEEPPVEEHVDSSVQEPLVDVQQCNATEEIHLASEDAEMVPVDEVPQAAHTSDEATQEADHTSDADHDSEENEDCTVEEETSVADDVDSPVQELPVEVQQCEETEEMIHLATEENEDVEEELAVAEDFQQCEATEDVHLAGGDTEMVYVNEVLQTTLKSGEVAHEVDFTSDVDEENEVTYEEAAAKTSENKEDIAADDEVTNNTDVADEEETVHASEENEVPNSEEVLHSAAKANEKKQDIAAEEETQDIAAEEVAADEMPQRSETMDVSVIEVVTIDNLSQATVTDEEGTVKESDFSCDLADVFLEGGVVAEDCAADSSVEEQHATAPSEEIQTSSDDTEMVPAPQSTLTSYENALQSAAKANKEKEEMVAVEVQQWSEAMYVEVVSTVDKGESGSFIADLTDVFMDEEAADEMPQSSATMEEIVEEVVTVENLSQVTETDDEWAVTLSAWLENMSRAKVTKDEGAVKEAVTVEEAAAVENLSQAKESEVTGDLQPAFDAARDFSDHVASPLSANVFEDAAKSLSMDSITVKPADAPLCVYDQSDRQMKITEPMSVQVKVAKKPEALGSLSRRRLKMKFKADDAPLCIYSNSVFENDVKENNESEALDSLSLRKLRTEFNEIVAVAQENGVKEGKKSSVPLDALSLRKLRLKLKETLNAQNQKNGELTRVPLGRLDENAY